MTDRDALLALADSWTAEAKAIRDIEGGEYATHHTYACALAECANKVRRVLGAPVLCIDIRDTPVKGRE